MALGLRKRKSDSSEVKALFAIHDILNHGGKRWIKGRYHKRIDGVTCRCLEGAVISCTTSHSSTRYYVRQLLGRAISRNYSPYQGIVVFNDHPRTEWSDIERVIRVAIQEGRSEDGKTRS